MVPWLGWVQKLGDPGAGYDTGLAFSGLSTGLHRCSWPMRVLFAGVVVLVWPRSFLWGWGVGLWCAELYAGLGVWAQGEVFEGGGGGELLACHRAVNVDSKNQV